MTVEQHIQKLMRCICQTREEELDGMTWDLQMIKMAELAACGENIAAKYPAIQQYFNNSPDCHEEFKALVAMIKCEMENQEES